MKRMFARIVVVVLPIMFFSSCLKDFDNNNEQQNDPLPDNRINAIYITEDGVKYFATNKGLASFDGAIWRAHANNPKIFPGRILSMDFHKSILGDELWLGTDKGINALSVPVDAYSGATTYNTQNTRILFPGEIGLAGDTVFSLKIDGRNIHWYGTNAGLSVFNDPRWPVIDRSGTDYYPGFFTQNRVSSIGYRNDTIYIGTLGGGVARMIATSGDAISGASAWQNPWNMLPSNNILSIHIDGNVQWFGTEYGLAKHTGIEAKEGWEIFGEFDGMAGDRVQAISKDSQGILWIGTDKGLSRYNGESFTNYTINEGLIGNNILSIGIDIDGSIWIGTDNGLSHYKNGIFTNYQEP